MQSPIPITTLLPNLIDPDTFTIDPYLTETSKFDEYLGQCMNGSYGLDYVPILTTAQIAQLNLTSISGYGNILGTNQSYQGITINSGALNSGYNNAGLTITPYPNITTNQNHSLTVQGTAHFEDEIIIKGKKLSEILEGIENRLAILHPTSELEERWEELKELRNKYIELEKNIIEKEKIWNELKK